MKKRYISTRFTVSQTPKEVFSAINDVSAWWTGKITGSATKLGDEFTYRYGDMHTSKQRVTTLVPGKKVVWLVVSARLNFVANRKEWNGTEITFDIAKKVDKTELRFSHVGLDSDQECFEDCSSAWSSLIKGNLKQRISTGVAASMEKI